MPDSIGKRTFEEINQGGCNYGWMWLKVNEAAAMAAKAYGLTPYDQKTKAQIMAIVLAVMDSLNQQGVLVPDAKTAKDFIMKSPVFLERELNAKEKSEKTEGATKRLR